MPGLYLLRPQSVGSSNGNSSCRRSPRRGCFLRQRRNRAARCLKTGLVRLPVREALACRILHGNRRTVAIVETEFDTMIVAEIKLSQVPVQMLLFAVLVIAAHTAFKNREVAFR